MKSPGFSSFRELMDLWDEQLNQQEKQSIKAILDGGGFIFFFKIGNDLYGGGEQDRLQFSRMKNPEDGKKWAKEASFVGVSLDSALHGIKKQAVFSYNDLKRVKVIDQDKAYALLVKKAEKEPKGKLNLKFVTAPSDEDDDPQTPHNFNKQDEY